MNNNKGNNRLAFPHSIPKFVYKRDRRRVFSGWFFCTIWIDFSTKFDILLYIFFHLKSSDFLSFIPFCFPRNLEFSFNPCRKTLSIIYLYMLDLVYECT